jgi:hypothetical protein
MDFRSISTATQNPYKFLRKLAFILFCLLAAYQISVAIVSNDFVQLGGIGLVAFIGAAAIAVLNDWRRGLLAFLALLLFEDMVRKYAGNNMLIAFGKDVLLAIVYLSFFRYCRRNKIQRFRPLFYVPLVLFVWFAVLQVLNPASPSIWFGLLGLKLDFYYVPLIFVGYHFVDSESRLRQFFIVNLALILIVASLGVAQSILGHTFLNPTNLAEDIRDLGALYRVSPISGAISYRPTSVFVSAGRFADFLALAWLFALGYTGYSMLRARRGRIFVFTVLGVTAAAAVLSASRGAFMWSLLNGTATVIAFFWGAPWRQRETVRVLRVAFRFCLAITVALMLLAFFFPDALASRLALYSETLSPTSAGSELGHRTWDYPITNLLGAFSFERWPYGYGIGTSSLGIQYIARYFMIKPLGIGVESGYGTIVLEMGIVGLFLWLVMTISIVFASWRVVVRMRGSPLFPIGFVIFWFALVLFFPATFAGMQPYQDFVLNAYVWLLLGILFKLPAIKLSTATDAPLDAQAGHPQLSTGIGLG